MKGDKLIMSANERKRKTVMMAVLEGRMTLIEASKQIDKSYRQAKRILKRYRLDGDAGLIHQNRGKKPNCAKPIELKSQVISLYESTYKGFGPTFASEKLDQRDGLKVHPETLRLWLKEAGLWSKQRKRNPYRQRRERKAQFGEMVQVDGSFHDWLGDGQARCLMHMVDDATGTSLAALSPTGESIQGAFEILKNWIEKYGVPRILYVDRHSTYVGCSKGEADNEEPNGHFAVACKALGIRIIKARSPQAKGRVEKKHALFQDRFCKEIKLNQIVTLEAANEFLRKKFLPEINERYCEAPMNPEDGHLPLIHNLYQTLVVVEERQVQNDYTLSFYGQCWQLKNPRRAGVTPKKIVTIRRHLNGSLSAWLAENELEYEPINPSQRKQKPTAKASPRDPREIDRNRKNRVNESSPWRQFNPGWLSA